nr:hypothetical protein GCM10020185_68990 [Pseudomonas brassicacearum subsp. brassicacearum]
MQGGYNIVTLVELLDDAELAPVAAEELKHTLLMFDAFHDVAEKKPRMATFTPKPCCNPGLTASGSRSARCWPTRSACACSR